jgi:hypothetical protein
MRICCALVAGLLTGCASAPDTYPPQHEPVTGPERLAYGDYVHAADPGAEGYILKDIRGLEGHYRWTGPNPELRFFLKTADRLNFRLEYGVHPVTLKDVGPLEFTIEVNGHVLANLRETTPGDKTFLKRVPPQWLVAQGDNVVKISVRNPWQTPDKYYLGFVFLGAGFVE